LEDTESSSAAALDQQSEIANLRDAPVPERLATLRRLAHQRDTVSGQTDTVPAEVGEQSRRARLTNRLRDRFHIGTHRVAEVPESNTAVPTIVVDEAPVATETAPAVVAPRT